VQISSPSVVRNDQHRHRRLLPADQISRVTTTATRDQAHSYGVCDSKCFLATVLMLAIIVIFAPARENEEDPPLVDSEAYINKVL
jgi:hypothetical protein